MRPFDWNSLGWPGRGFVAVGQSAEETALPLVRDVGRLVRSVGDILEGPALCVEGLLIDPGWRGLHGLDRLALGVGSTVTAALNLPFFFASWEAVDLGREAGAVNDALRTIDLRAATMWHSGVSDDRDEMIPRGTRVEAVGDTLLWSFPGGAQRVQAAQNSPVTRWTFALSPGGDAFVVQERSWGFVVPDIDRWNDTPQRERVVIILHEFVHQEMQVRRWFRGWNLAYWPAYLGTFVSTGWVGHWAETEGSLSAGAVDRALVGWHGSSLNGASCRANDWPARSKARQRSGPSRRAQPGRSPPQDRG